MKTEHESGGGEGGGGTIEMRAMDENEYEIENGIDE